MYRKKFDFSVRDIHERTFNIDVAYLSLRFGSDLSSSILTLWTRGDGCEFISHVSIHKYREAKKEYSLASRQPEIRFNALLYIRGWRIILQT